MNLATFRVMFPELVSAPDGLVTHFLNISAGSISPEVYGARFDEAHGYLTAHLLAISPFGKNARLQSEKGETTYGKRYEQIRIEVSPGFRVL